MSGYEILQQVITDRLAMAKFESDDEFLTQVEMETGKRVSKDNKLVARYPALESVD